MYMCKMEDSWRNEWKRHFANSSFARWLSRIHVHVALHRTTGTCTIHDDRHTQWYWIHVQGLVQCTLRLSNNIYTTGMYRNYMYVQYIYRDMYTIHTLWACSILLWQLQNCPACKGFARHYRTLARTRVMEGATTTTATRATLNCWDPLAIGSQAPSFGTSAI